MCSVPQRRTQLVPHVGRPCLLHRCAAVLDIPQHSAAELCACLIQLANGSRGCFPSALCTEPRHFSGADRALFAVSPRALALQLGSGRSRHPRQRWQRRPARRQQWMSTRRRSVQVGGARQCKESAVVLLPQGHRQVATKRGRVQPHHQGADQLCACWHCSKWCSATPRPAVDAGCRTDAAAAGRPPGQPSCGPRPRRGSRCGVHAEWCSGRCARTLC
jgi:hypothetical protein